MEGDERALSRASRRRVLVVVRYLDLDRFELVDDNLDHDGCPVRPSRPAAIR